MITATKQIKHYTAISNKYTRQPNGNDMRVLTNYMKFNTQAERIPIEQLLKLLSSGHNAIISNYEIDNSKNFRFVSSSLIMIDIDDDHQVKDPKEVLKDLSSFCTGLFYTWSHELKGNRYRLVFQLDQQVTSEKDYKLLVNYILENLEAIGLPVDSIKSPTQVVRGGNSKEPLINDFNKVLNVSEILPKARAKAELDHQNKLVTYDELLENPPTFEQLKEMVDLIGYIPSGVDRREEWGMVINSLKNTVDMGIISEGEGFELFHIISGDEATERDWRGLRNPVSDYRAIINLAKDYGYKHNSYAYAQKKTVPIIPTEIIRDVERVKDKTYLKKDFISKLFERNQKILIDSSTGSGKTQSTLDAMKDLSNKDDNIFYLFLAPTRALVEQTAKAHNLPHIKGGINPYSTIRRGYNYNDKVFIVIYDLLKEVLKAIDSVTHSNFKVRVVIDEVHQLTNAYSYRQNAIKEMYKLFDDDRVLSLIGLSGTVENIQKNKFEQMYKLNDRNAGSTLTDFRVYTYKEIDGTGVTNSGNNLTARLIHNLVNGKAKQDKVLLFVNDKERSESIKRTLKQYDIKSVTINSNKKQSSTYREVIDNETFSEDVKVIIATTTLAEGINLRNGLNWACIVLSDGKSRLFDPSTIKQISHRFRNQYRHFILVTRPPNEEKYPSNKRFYIESDFNHRKKVSNNLSSYLNEEHAEDIEKTFIASGTEKNHGLYLDETEVTPTVKYNKDYLRLRSMQEKEFYYSTYKNAFIKEVSRVLGHEPKSVTCINDELESNGLDLLELDSEDDEGEATDDKTERLNNFRTYFNEHVYNAYSYKDDSQTIKHFEKHVHEIKVNALKNTIKISDVEICYEVCLRINRPSEIKVYYRDIKSLTQVAYFNHIKKDTLEKRIYTNVKKETKGNKYTTKDLDNVVYMLSNKIKFKRQSIKKNDVKGVVKMFDKESTKTAEARLYELKNPTIESVAKKHGITTEQVKKSILMYIETLPPRQQNILYKSVKSEYGIDKKTN